MADDPFNGVLGRKLRMGLVGGAGQAFIGPVHAAAAQLDNRAELVAGALSSDPDRSRAAAAAFGIASQRAYGSFRELITAEAALPGDQRIDFVSIATPNHTHFEIAQAALEAGFHVVCDKPLTTQLEHAQQLESLVGQTGRVFALTHNYSGYPLVRQAREMVCAGELGEIQAVRASYIQGFLQGLAPGTPPPRAWKSDPQKAGSGSLGDIGTHAYHLACYVTGLRASATSAVMRTYHPERPLEDYGHALVRFENALGMITFSQVTHGRFNDLSLEVDGSKASLTWRQETPNQLVVRRFGHAAQVYERDPQAAYSHDSSRHACRLPVGHPEGFVEAFANIYRGAFDDMVAWHAGQPITPDGRSYPTVQDGVAGVRFIIACQSSNQDNGAWTSL